MSAFPDPALEVADDFELTLPEACSRPNGFALIEKLLANGAHPNKYVNGRTALMGLVDNQEWDPVAAELLIEYGVDLNLGSVMAPPVLWYCVMKGHKPAFEFFVSKGANFDDHEASLPPYLRNMTLREFMTKMEFKSSVIPKDPLKVTSITTFQFDGRSLKHPHDAHLVIVNGLEFAIKMIEPGSCATCNNVTTKYPTPQTAVFVGLHAGKGIIIPKTYRIKYSFAIDYRRFATEEWTYGKQFEFVLEDPKLDWGYKEFEASNNWNVYLLDGKSRQFRVNLTLHQTHLTW